MAEYGNPLEAFGRGQGLVQNAFDQSARMRAGNALSGGDYAGGANALFKGGLIDEGSKVQDQGYQQQARQKAQADAARAEKLTVLAKAADALGTTPDDPQHMSRRQHLQARILPALQQMGYPPEVLQALSDPNLDLSDQSLQMFKGSIAKEIEQFTLAPGSARYDTTGRQIAAQPFAPQYRTVGEGQSLVEVGPPGAQPQSAPTEPQGDWLAAVSAAAPDAQVTSGYRTAEHNKAVGGVPTSRHLSGQAVDLVPRPGETMAQLYARVSKVPGVKAINEGDHVHVQATGGGQAQGGARVIAQGAPNPMRALQEENLRSQIAERNAKAAHGGTTPLQSRKEFATLRKEFNQLEEVKNFKDVAASYQQVRALAKPNASAADDVALTFSFMKMLDPGSVVREGEYALVGRTAGLDDQIIMGLQKIDQGKGLTPEIRTKLVNAAAQIMLQRRKQYDNVAGQYRQLAADAGANPDQLTEAPGAWQGRIKTGGQVAKSSGPAAPKPGVVVKGYRFKGGDPAIRASWIKVN